LVHLRHELVRRNFFIRFVWDLSLPTADVHWIRHDGQRMSDQDWHDGKTQVGVLFTNQRSPRSSSPTAQTRDIFLVFNSYHEPLVAHLPDHLAGHLWRLRVDTFRPERHSLFCKTGQYVVEPRSVCLFELAALRWMDRIRLAVEPR
jgi:isoamylase